ncbi:FtsX-like permease family protein [Compostimonas suwonensis]|uniref:Putative ABC transport system permease protein n=1 Tax=Compostimonas suwonensis TaxID=1048394 RepID=A0A2M9BVE3_9MICO|nr:FtsX-like permease family protein [Compostimonas suwonensis]PJJ61927.1 putative ABC transport system permease protein [Compostimonas suwonensis]
MILVVAAKELVRGYRLWLGSLIVVVAASAVCAATLAQIETAAALPAEASGSLQSASITVLAFTVLAAIAITGATTNLAVASGRRGYALLQLAGILPRQVTAMVLAQLVMLALIGTGTGVGLGRIIAQPLLDLVVVQTSAPAGTVIVYGGTALWAFGLFAGVVVLSGIRAARRAGRVPPIEALREPEPPRIRMRASRWVATGISGAASIGVGLAVAAMSPSLTPDGRPVGLDSVTSLGLLLSIALTTLAVSLGPILYPSLMRAWTAVIPSGLSGSWFLARRSCRYRITQSTAAITPLMVGIAMPGSMYTVFLTAANAMAAGGGPTDINSASIFTSLGPALLLAALGSAAVIFMTSRTRARDNALVSVSGGTFTTTTLSAIFEAVIYVVTAFLIALSIFGVVGLVVAIAFAHTMTGVVPVYGIGTALIVAGAGAVIVGVATVAPAVAPTRRSIPSLLASE